MGEGESITGELTGADSEALLVRNWRWIVYYFLGRARWPAGNCAGLEERCRQFPPYDPGEAPQIHIHKLLLARMLHLGSRPYARAERAFREAAELEGEARATLAVYGDKRFLSLCAGAMRAPRGKTARWNRRSAARAARWSGDRATFELARDVRLEAGRRVGIEAGA